MYVVIHIVLAIHLLCILFQHHVKNIENSVGVNIEPCFMRFVNGEIFKDVTVAFDLSKICLMELDDHGEKI